jgi:hypothetical protein
MRGDKIMDTSQIKTDCFGYEGLSKKTKCRVLTELMCEKSKCPFYKTWGQFDNGIKKHPWALDAGKCYLKARGKTSKEAEA